MIDIRKVQLFTYSTFGLPSLYLPHSVFIHASYLYTFFVQIKCENAGIKFASNNLRDWDNNQKKEYIPINKQNEKKKRWRRFTRRMTVVKNVGCGN